MRHFFITLFSCLSLTLSGQPYYFSFDSNVYFKPNSTDMIEDANYKKFEEGLKILKEYPDNVTHVYISSSTSPDGNTWSNIDLCNKRSWKVIDMVLKYVTSDKVYIMSHGEDYDLLYDLVDESNDPDKTLILNILTIHRNPKYHLKQYPEIWKRLEKQYFHLLRRVHVEIYIEK